MDYSSEKKSLSLEALALQKSNNVEEITKELNNIISAGATYDTDVFNALKLLLSSKDETILLLTIQAISELAKCEVKRETYAQKCIIEPILQTVNRDCYSNNFELLKQCLRALGNLCCDCDISRKIVLETDGITILNNMLLQNIENGSYDELKLLTLKTLLNYAIGGQEYTKSLEKCGVIDQLKKILLSELAKDDMDDNLVSTLLMILSVINDNSPELVYDDEVNVGVLNILKETANIDICELALEQLHSQVQEHDSVKTLLAKEGGVQLLCTRLEQLVERHDAGELSADDSQVEVILKQACYLIVLVLTGDDAMAILYKDGVGEVYLTMVKWLDSPNQHFLSTALLAIGNFARKDEYCIQMMTDNIYDKLLDIFEIYYNLSLKQKDGETPIDKSTLNQIQHAALSAVRNLSIPVANKRVAAAQGRVAPLLLKALPNVEDHHVAYKLMATLRMLVDGQEAVCSRVLNAEGCIRAVCAWGSRAEHSPAAEAQRLLAWTLRHVHRRADVLQAEGCVQIIVNMLISPHSVMQNEAILALTLLSIEVLNAKTHDLENTFITQIIKSEIGKHIAVLIETNSGKMPVEVAENLLAFLDVTSKCSKILYDYNENKVHNALQKFVDARNDFSEVLKTCATDIIKKISEVKTE